MATHSSILVWRITIDKGVWQAIVHVVTKSWTQAHIYIFFQIIFNTLVQNIEYSFLIYTVGHCWLSIIYIVVYTF